MQARKHAIVTASKANRGDFLRDHWLPSLQENVRLDDIDVHVLDYGLTDEQRAGVDRRGVIRHGPPADGLVNNIRWRDLAGLLKDADYDQVLAIDSGDVIFQSDISERFEDDPCGFRAVCEEVYTAQYEHFITTTDFEQRDYE
jgi:hypothetical protein